MLQLMLQLLALLHGDSSLDIDAELSGVYQPDSERELDAVYSFGTSPAHDDSHHQSLLQQQHAPDLHLLLLATLVVLVLAVPTFAWLSRHRHTPSAPGRTQQQRNRRGNKQEEDADAGFTTTTTATFAAREAAVRMNDSRRTPQAAATPPTDRPFRRTPQSERPFRFRAADVTDVDAAAEQQQHDNQHGSRRGAARELQAPHTAPTNFRVRRSQQVALRSPPQVRQQQQHEEEEDELLGSPEQQQLQPQQQAGGGWDPELLQQCAANQAFISSEEALQTSPLFVSHIRSVRGKQLSYERKESHKLRVLRALREVDPDSFQRLFSRTDIKEYDEIPLTRSQAAFEWVCSSLITLACLALPLLPAYSSYRAAGAATWLLLALWAVSRGCTSLPAWLLNAHATHGEFAMLAPTWRLLAAVVFEAALVLLPGGLLLTLACRLRSEERQNGGEWLLRLTPLREVVRPCHFSPLLSPAAARGGGAGYHTGDNGTDDDAVGARLFHD